MDCLLISDFPDSQVLFSGNWMDNTSGSGKRKHWSIEETTSNISNKMRKQSCDGMNGWEQVEELAADLDGSCSLSNLSVDLNNSNFTTSDGLLALPSLSAFKQELLSPLHNNDLSLNKACSLSPGHEKNSSEFQGGDIQSHVGRVVHDTGLEGDMVGSGLNHHSPGHSPSSPLPLEDCRFQYVLAAATSIATKVSEETLTYLNQGQSYEIKLKKLGDLSECKGKLLKTIVRLCFHERRLQYTEREQLLAWEAMHPGDSILEVDLPLSYGIVDICNDVESRNHVEILWDPTKEVGLYIKVNAISTEFTPKKHGGEKGVPFRIQVDTYLASEPLRKIHSASCQVKVFKLKGADRKHKQDREKVMKRPLIEQEKYQSSCECTILTDLPINGEFDNSPPPSVSGNPLTQELKKLRVLSGVAAKEEHVVPNLSPYSLTDSQPPSYLGVANWTPEETATWLSCQRFQTHLPTLGSYSGADLLRLSRDQFVQLIGLADGLRLYNALHAPAPPPARTIYVTADGRFHRPLYLSVTTKSELRCRLAAAFSLHSLSSIVVAGPAGIRILVSDELVQHIPDHSAFTVQLLPGESGDGTTIQALLIPSNCQIT